MNRGKWYLAFTWHNDFEPCGGVTEHEEIPLKATTEDEAIAEAKAKEKERVTTARTEWEKQGKKWGVTKPGSKYAPNDLCVIYKIPLQ